MSERRRKNDKTVDHSNKSILARGCDPEASLEFAKIVSPLIGNAEYVPTTDDVDFVEKLKYRKWSVVFFAPGACRFSAAKAPIPGGNFDTQGWTLDQYRELVYELQGEDILIVETMYENKTVGSLNTALIKARDLK